MSGDRFGYARVSTLDQHPALRLDALKAAGCAKVWTDHATGKRGDRVTRHIAGRPSSAFLKTTRAAPPARAAKMACRE